MSEPVNIFQQTRKHLKTGNLTFLAEQVATWQKLTQLVQPILPQPEIWQVVCYQQGILTITGLNQAMISQLAYLQKQYIAKLIQIDELKDLQKIHVRLRVESKILQDKKNLSKTLSPETQEMIKCAADCVTDPKLSQAMHRLASHLTNKK